MPSEPSQATTGRDLKALPKGHLHLHLEAGMRSETLRELADQMGVELPPTVGAFTGFTAFSETYRGLLAVLREPENLERLFFEAAEDAANDGCVYLEAGVAPLFYVDTYGSPMAALDAMRGYAAAAGEKYGVAVGLMVTTDRQGPVSDAMVLAEIAAERAGQGVVSYGLANDERDHPCRWFEEPFAIAKAAGLQSTPHAGELVGPESVWEAIDVLKADRVLHGVTAVTDEQLVAQLVEREICLDICPTSNQLLDVVEDLSQHPIKVLLEAGVRCSINADDPILFGPNILQEYELARHTIGLTDEQLAACALSSIECTLAPEAVKTKARTDIDAWLASSPA